MNKVDKLLNEACQRCESFGKGFRCEDKVSCPVFQLYEIAKSNNKVIDRSSWAIPPTPIPEMI